MRALLPLVAAAALLTAGCLAGNEALTATSADDAALAAITPVRARATMPFQVDGEESAVLEPGLFGILGAQSVFVDVAVPLGEGVPVQQAHLGLFLPDVPGCDWSATDLPAECKVPVVADVGPYYADGDLPATDPETRRLGGFLIRNLVPHGYAVAQVSVMGTGLSGGCMDLMGEIEQAGVQAAVEWLGTQPWSNGAVGLIGRSYDGSTPWEAAMSGSPHLKTVVPISGLYGQHDLMWKNGSAELRGPGVLWGLYYTFTYSPAEGTGPGVFGPLVPTPEYAPEHARRVGENAVCPDTQTGAAHAAQAYLTGDTGALGYWEERSFKDEVLANYEGSVYFIHGMQDWNVDPHMAFPFYGELQAKGLEMKGLFGQWAHNYPDRLAEHENCDGNDGWCAAPTSVRYDWAQDLKEWFDHYLKGTGAKPELHVEIQDHAGRWRIEETWPPADAAWSELKLREDLEALYENPVAPANAPIMAERNMESAYATTLEKDTHIAGLPQFHVTVTPLGPGGQLYAELVDGDGDHLGHAIMDLRYAAGGTAMKPVVPGQPLTAYMEFEPMDVYLPAGETLELRVRSTGMDYMPAVTSATVLLGDGVLKLPLVERPPEAFFTPPGHAAP